MPAELLSGKRFADEIKAEAAERARAFSVRNGRPPGLTVVQVGDDAASSVYVGNKVKTAGETGILASHIHLPSAASTEDVLSVVEDLNRDEAVDGILVQLPLPPGVDAALVLESIDPFKDVDGFHPLNAGRLMQAQPALHPCTPAGVIEILERSAIPIAGKHAVIVGRSNIVGKPMALLLLQGNATVTVCHSHTKDLASITRHADILVAAIGKAGFITGEHIREGSVVIDVGINQVSDRGEATGLFSGADLEKRLNAIENRGFTLVGDVKPRDAMIKAAYFTPVPGGVGLLTVSMLMKNTVAAAETRSGLVHPTGN